jgi:glycosyltransferase involved in cell wall biosynthesis
MLFILPKIKTNTVLDNPLVSVICLCFNQANLVEKAIQSVLHQTYDNIELIVIDDASTDKSRSIIEKLSKTHGFQAHFNPTNLGNCASFNIGFELSKGKYIIDLAADDQLMPPRIIKGVKNLEARGQTYAVVFCVV